MALKRSAVRFRYTPLDLFFTIRNLYLIIILVEFYNRLVFIGELCSYQLI